MNSDRFNHSSGAENRQLGTTKKYRTPNWRDHPDKIACLLQKERKSEWFARPPAQSCCCNEVTQRCVPQALQHEPVSDCRFCAPVTRVPRGLQQRTDHTRIENRIETNKKKKVSLVGYYGLTELIPAVLTLLDNDHHNHNNDCRSPETNQNERKVC